jgi:hypothetical protein
MEHLLEQYISTKLKMTNRLFGQNGLTFEKKICLAESCGGSIPKTLTVLES